MSEKMENKMHSSSINAAINELNRLGAEFLQEEGNLCIHIQKGGVFARFWPSTGTFMIDGKALDYGFAKMTRLMGISK